ncbi:MAG: copper-binding protein [Alphaproteobacteria bacterium]|jgi:uncharacterized cupredoxin-like copper-binding protein|nr:copper-binding protein [Alphaproteobacteria bacterium]
MFRSLALASLLATLSIPHAFAAPDQGAREFGQAVPAAQAKRTITITMKDNEYEPKSVTVKAGEVVRFIVVNKGDLLHEFAVGRPQDHAEHQKMMAMMLDHGMITPTSIDHKKMKMDHGGQTHRHGPETGSVLVEPGKRAELTWKFPQAMTLQFACTIPGHYEAGMVGKFNYQ